LAHESQGDIDVATCGGDVVSHKPVLQKLAWNYVVAVLGTTSYSLAKQKVVLR